MTPYVRLPLLRVAGWLALVLLMGTLAPRSAHAQNPPFSVYGWVQAGQLVGAWIEDDLCAQTEAGIEGFWLLRISEGGECGAEDGATVSFTVNGLWADHTETWRPGGGPSNAEEGVLLEVAFADRETDVDAKQEAVFLGSPPDEGGFALMVTAVEATPGRLAEALAAGGCPVQSFSVTRESTWVVYVSGAPEIVNAAFPEALPRLSAFLVRC